MAGSQAFAVFVVVLAVACGLLSQYAGEIAVQGPAPGSSVHPTKAPLPSRWVLGSPEYDVKVLDAPIATGWKLHVVQWMLTKSFIGPILRRLLLNNNQVVMLRELAYQVNTSEVPIMYRPLRRMSPEQHADIEQLAVTGPALPDVLQSPGLLPRSQPPLDERNREHYYWEVTDYAEAYRAGTVTPSQAMERVLAGAKRLQHLKAFMSIDEDDVRAQAAASDARFAAGQPLSVFDGVPIAVKDMLDVKGHVTTFGTRHTDGGKPAERDDICVARFREAGAIILGTTIMTEFGVTPIGWNSHYKGPYNPYDTRFVSGGSSSGSAVAVAAGIVPVAIGADGGGSIRIPAALSGVYGFMPGFMRVPWDSPGALSMTMVHVGPLTATARDAALAYAVMAPNQPGHFHTEIYGGHGPPVPHLAGYSGDPSSLRGLRVGVYRPHMEDAPEHLVAAADATLAYLTQQGAIVVPIVIPNLQALQLSHGFGISMEFSLNEDWRYHNDDDDSHNLPLESSTRLQLGLGAAMSGVELLAANRLRAWGFQQLAKIFEDVDVILSPTVGTATPALTEELMASGVSDTALVVRMMKYIFMGNLMGFPAVSVPVGYGPGAGLDANTSLPIGVHLMADHWQEHVLLQAAAALEAGLAGRLRKRPEAFVDVDLATPAGQGQ